MLRGLPVLANTLDMARDPLQLFVRGYNEIGPVFRVRAANRVFNIIAGPTAFEFVANGGEVHLNAEEMLGATGALAGAKRNMFTVSGEDHAHMRKAQRAGYSKTAFLKDASNAFTRTDARLNAWRAGQIIDIFPVLQRLVMEQLALALIGEEANDYFDDVRTYIATVLNVRVHGLWPEITMRTPRFKRARARFIEAGQNIIQKRKSGEAPARGDLIDDTMAYIDLHGNKFDDRELMMNAMSPFVAGMDTAAAMASYLLYDLLTHPNVMQQIVAEVDAHFTPDAISQEMFMKMPTLHGAAMETLRMHTIALGQPRVASHDFEVGGFVIRKGEQVMLSGSVSHFLPEFYPEPYRYDPERFHTPRYEHRKKHAYAPYGIGAHLCLGAGVAEIQFPLNIALLLKKFALELHPRTYTLKLSNNPTPHPSGFKVRVMGLR
jgi:cytochrome P450